MKAVCSRSSQVSGIVSVGAGGRSLACLCGGESRRWNVAELVVRFKNLGVCASCASVTAALAELGLELELSGLSRPGAFSPIKEKGGKEKELPVHHKLEELLDEYLKTTGLGNEPGSLLFPAALGKTGKLSRRPLVRTDAADMLKRRLNKRGCRRTIHLTLSARPASRTFWKMMAPLRLCSTCSYRAVS